jgi:hypothetical protein
MLPAEPSESLIQSREILDTIEEYREQIKKEVLSKEKIFELLNFVVDTWKKEIYREWLPTGADHMCTVHTGDVPDKNKMNVTKLGVDCCVLENVVFTVFQTSNGSMHPCIKNHCVELGDSVMNRHLHHKKIRTFTELYICTYSSKPHFCGEFCSICSPDSSGSSEERRFYEKTLYNKDGTATCPLSGVCFNLQKSVNRMNIDQNDSQEYNQRVKDFKKFSETLDQEDARHFRLTREAITGSGKPSSSCSRDEDLGFKVSKSDFSGSRAKNMRVYANSFFRKRSRDEPDTMDFEFLLESVKKVLESQGRSEFNLREIRKSSYQTMKQFYLIIASLKIADILAPSRMEQYEENNEKKKQKLIKPFTSYVNKCFARSITPNVCELSAIMRDEEKTLFIPPMIKLPTGYLEAAVIDYAKLCINAWYAIVTQTRYGREETGCFKFTEFVDAFVSMIKTGYTVELGSGETVTIYSRDTFFNMVPNIDEEERKKGDYASKHKRKHIGQMKKRIQKAIAQTIIKENIHYNMLTPYHYDFEALEERYFVDIKEWQKNKKNKQKRRKKVAKKEEQTVPGTEQLAEILEKCQKIKQKRRKRGTGSGAEELADILEKIQVDRREETQGGQLGVAVEAEAEQTTY